MMFQGVPYAMRTQALSHATCECQGPDLHIGPLGSPSSRPGLRAGWARSAARGLPLPDETGWVDLSGSSDTLVITAVRL